MVGRASFSRYRCPRKNGEVVAEFENEEPLIGFVRDSQRLLGALPTKSPKVKGNPLENFATIANVSIPKPEESLRIGEPIGIRTSHAG
jgi:hypothetical protein